MKFPGSEYFEQPVLTVNVPEESDFRALAERLRTEFGEVGANEKKRVIEFRCPEERIEAIQSDLQGQGCIVKAGPPVGPC